MYVEIYHYKVRIQFCQLKRKENNEIKKNLGIYILPSFPSILTSKKHRDLDVMSRKKEVSLIFRRNFYITNRIHVRIAQDKRRKTNNNPSSFTPLH
jgi:hypothetical protein